MGSIKSIEYKKKCELSVTVQFVANNYRGQSDSSQTNSS